MGPRIAFAPEGAESATRGSSEGADQLRRQLVAAVEAAGGTVASIDEADALIWLDVGNAALLVALLSQYPNISWVQLPWAGVEHFPSDSFAALPVTFTCAKASYGEQVGEHALLLTLACLRHVVEQARQPKWHVREPQSLFRKRVTILGAGGIASTLIRLLAPFDCDIRVVRRAATPTPGADQTVGTADLHQLLPTTDILVLALALTPQTRHIIGAPELAALPKSAVVVNVARGQHLDTAALILALRQGEIAAAGLDVTDPEPLNDDSPLWAFDNVFISSHCGDSDEFVAEKLAERVRGNINRFRRGQDLEGQVDWSVGY